MTTKKTLPSHTLLTLLLLHLVAAMMSCWRVFNPAAPMFSFKVIFSRPQQTWNAQSPELFLFKWFVWLNPNWASQVGDFNPDSLNRNQGGTPAPGCWRAITHHLNLMTLQNFKKETLQPMRIPIKFFSSHSSLGESFFHLHCPLASSAIFTCHEKGNFNFLEFSISGVKPTETICT